MAKTTKISPPKRKRTKPIPPPVEDASPSNLDKPERTGTVQLKLNVDPAVRKEFKTFAAEHDITMSELLVKAFELYKQHPY